MKTLVILLVLFWATSVKAQIKDSIYADSLDKEAVKVEMMSKASQELIKYHRSMMVGVSLMAAGTAIIILDEVRYTDANSDDYPALLTLGAAVLTAGILKTVYSSIHIKRAGVYLEASLTGVTMRF